MKFGIDGRSVLFGGLAFAYVFGSLTLSGIPSLSYLTTLVAIALVLFSVRPALRTPKTTKRLLLIAGPFVLLAAVLSLDNLERSSVALISTVVAWISAIAIGLLAQRTISLRPILYALILASVANAIAISLGFDTYILFQADFRLTAEDELMKRPSGLVGNPNLAAVQSLIPLFLLIYWRQHADWILWFLGLVAGGYVFYMTGSRKAVLLLVLLVMMAVVGLSGGRKNPTLKMAAFIVTLLLAGLTLLMVDVDFAGSVELAAFDRIVLAMQGQDTSFDERSALIAMGLDLFQENPLWGYGLDSFRHLNSYGLYAHNNFVELLVSGGLLLVGAYYLIYYAILKNLWDCRHFRQRAKLGLILVVALLSLDIAMVTYNIRLIPLVLMLLLAHTATPRSATYRQPSNHPGFQALKREQ